MQNFITKNRIKMVMVIVLTYFMVKTVAPNLFIANSPEINPVFISDVINTPARIASMPGKFVASLKNIRLFNFDYSDNTPTSVDQAPVAMISVDPKVIAEVKYKKPPANVVFKEILKGVATGVNAETGEKYINVKAGTKYKVVGYININGKTYPKIEFVE